MSHYMTQEEQKEVAQGEEIETTSEQKTEEQDDTQSEKDSDKDLEAELTREREARLKAEKALADKAYKDREDKRKTKSEVGESTDEEDKPMTKRELQELLREERRLNEQRIYADRIESIANKLASSDKERELILEIHKNRTFPSHLSLEEQLEEAHLIANKKKLLGTNNELMRALKGKDTVVKDSSGSYQPEKQAGEPKLAGPDLAAIKAAGMTWNATIRQYEKKLPNGQYLVRGQNGKTFIRK